MFASSLYPTCFRFVSIGDMCGTAPISIANTCRNCMHCIAPMDTAVLPPKAPPAHSKPPPPPRSAGVKAGASPVFTSYLTTWLRELCEWVGFYTGERREQWKGFQKSLEQLRDTGVQPRQGEVQVHGGLHAWWQTHTECFTQEKSADNHSWQRATEPRPKRPRQAGPGVLQGVQDLIA